MPPPAPPNWKVDVAAAAGPGAAPKLNMPPAVEGWAEPALPVLFAKGLLNPDPEAAAPPPAEKLKPKPPDPVFVGAAPPKPLGALVPLVGAGPEVAPNRLVVADVVCAVFPKPNKEPDEPDAPPVNIFFAGEGSSCFIGLPNMLFSPAVGGDLGTPNRGFEAACDAAPELVPPVEGAPKLKTGFVG